MAMMVVITMPKNSPPRTLRITMKAQMEFLLPKNAITIHGMTQLRHLPRYMQALRIRLEEMSLDPDKDADRQAEVEDISSKRIRIACM